MKQEKWNAQVTAQQHASRLGLTSRITGKSPGIASQNSDLHKPQSEKNSTHDFTSTGVSESDNKIKVLSYHQEIINPASYQ